MIEVGKCYKIISPNENIYIFRIKDFIIKEVVNWIKENKPVKYYYINVEVGFIIETNTNYGIGKVDYTLIRDINTDFIEIEEKDMDKLVHYYNIMEKSFNSIVNKYK